jgi:hypothetical protein
MDNKLKNIIKTIQPEFESEDSWYNEQLPNEVSLYLDTDEHLIDLHLKDDVLHTNIWIEDEEYEVTDEDADFIYKHLNKLLDNEIELTKRYYNEEKYEQNRY